MASRITDSFLAKHQTNTQYNWLSEVFELHAFLLQSYHVQIKAKSKNYPNIL